MFCPNLRLQTWTDGIAKIGAEAGAVGVEKFWGVVSSKSYPRWSYGLSYHPLANR